MYAFEGTYCLMDIAVFAFDNKVGRRVVDVVGVDDVGLVLLTDLLLLRRLVAGLE
jgi:hypothetical protein